MIFLLFFFLAEWSTEDTIIRQFTVISCNFNSWIMSSSCVFIYDLKFVNSQYQRGKGIWICNIFLFIENPRLQGQAKWVKSKCQVFLNLVNLTFFHRLKVMLISLLGLENSFSHIEKKSKTFEIIILSNTNIKIKFSQYVKFFSVLYRDTFGQ